MNPFRAPYRLLLATLLGAAAPFSLAAEISFFDDGPLAGRGLPFSESVRAGDLLFLAGQIGTGPDGELLPGGIEPEAEQTLRNVTAALQRRGLGLADVVKCTVFLADIAEWPRFNEVYKRHFQAPYPARSALGANGLAMGARVEVECIAAYR
jgi:2-iminobutanoate/2-iminopropanoate deaminase